MPETNEMDQSDEYSEQEIPESGSGEALSSAEHSRLAKRLKIEEAIETAAPTFPRVPFHLYHQMNGITVNLQDIEEAVAMDWGLRKAILRHANSSYYGGVEVDSVHQAVLRIGMNEFKNVIFQYGIQSGLDNLSFSSGNQDFWTHSIMVARLTVRYHLCYHDTPAPGYAAGLLHDMGKIFISQVLPDDAKLIEQLVEKHQYTEDQAERQVFGMHHEHVSALLCRKWGVSEMVAAAVEHHHQPDSLQLSPDQSTLSCCLAVANAIAERISNRLDALEYFDFNDMEWCKYYAIMQKYTALRPFKIDATKEIQLIRRTISSMRPPTAKREEYPDVEDLP